MTAQAKAKLRALPTIQVAQRMKRAQDRGNISAKWRYFFELSLRAMEARLWLLDEEAGQ